METLGEQGKTTIFSDEDIIGDLQRPNFNRVGGVGNGSQGGVGIRTTGFKNMRAYQDMGASSIGHMFQGVQL